MIAEEGSGTRMKPMMNNRQRGTYTAEHRSGPLLTALATLLIAVLMILPHHAEAKPFVGADFQRFDGLSLGGHPKAHAKVHKIHKERKLHGKVTKKPTASSPHRSRRRTSARAWAQNAGVTLTTAAASILSSSSAGSVGASWLSLLDAETPILDKDRAVSGDALNVSDEVSVESIAEDVADEVLVDPSPTPELIDLALQFVSGSDVTNSHEIITELDDRLLSLPISDPVFDSGAQLPLAQLPVPRPVPEPNTVFLVGLAILAGRWLPRTLRQGTRSA